MKIVMFCAGGLSSSLLVNKVKIAAKKRNLDIEFEAHGSRSFTKLEGADVLLVAPQVRHMKQIYEGKTSIPIGIIDFKTYGSMDGEKVLDLALELLSTKTKTLD